MIGLTFEQASKAQRFRRISWDVPDYYWCWENGKLQTFDNDLTEEDFKANDWETFEKEKPIVLKDLLFERNWGNFYLEKDVQKLYDEILKALKGIDKEEIYDKDGYWETDKGVERGKEILSRIKELFGFEDEQNKYRIKNVTKNSFEIEPIDSKEGK